MRIDRLMILLDHMEQPKGFHEHFYFGNYNIKGDNRFHPNECGTAGCMGGELPGIFPEYWRFNSLGTISLLNNECESTMKDLMEFFDITKDEAQHLFTPLNQMPHLYGGYVLLSDATKEQVTYNLRIFIERALDNGVIV